MPPNPNYTSYLLRFWQVQNGQQTTWVASIQHTTTGEQHSFSGVAALIDFLNAEFGPDTCTSQDRRNES